MLENPPGGIFARPLTQGWYDPMNHSSLESQELGLKFIGSFLNISLWIRLPHSSESIHWRISLENSNVRRKYSDFKTFTSRN